MKAVVLEVRGKEAAVLDHNGIFRKIVNRDFAVGQILELEKEKEILPGYGLRSFRARTAFRRHAVGIAAAVALAVLCTAGGFAATSIPVSSVVVEMDSPVTYRLNLFDRVLSVEGLEDDPGAGKELQSQVKGKRMDQALEITLDHMLEEGSISENDTPVNVTVNTHFGKKPALENMLQDGAATWNEKDKPHDAGSIHMILDQDNAPAPDTAALTEPGPADQVKEDAFSGQSITPEGLSDPAVLHGNAPSGNQPDVRASQADAQGNQPPAPGNQSDAQSDQPPVQGNQPDAQADQPPVQGNQPDIRVNQPPAQESQPDVQANQPPTQGNQPDVQANQPPAQGNRFMP